MTKSNSLPNIDTTNGIHFGVISWNSVMSEALDDMEADYGKPRCPKCGNEAHDSNADCEECNESDSLYQGSKDYHCHTCKSFPQGIPYSFWSDFAFSDEPLGHSYDAKGYKLESSGNDGFGIFVTKSPYYTFARYCSPCAPNAGDLDSPIDIPHGGIDTSVLPRTYCLGHDWFEGGSAPYRVFSVSDDSEIKAGDK